MKEYWVLELKIDPVPVHYYSDTCSEYLAGGSWVEEIKLALRYSDEASANIAAGLMNESGGRNEYKVTVGKHMIE